MGNVFSQPNVVNEGAAVVVQNQDGVEAVRGQKRAADSEDEAEIDKLMHTPKKKKLKTTSR